MQAGAAAERLGEREAAADLDGFAGPLVERAGPVGQVGDDRALDQPARRPLPIFGGEVEHLFQLGQPGFGLIGRQVGVEDEPLGTIIGRLESVLAVRRRQKGEEAGRQPSCLRSWAGHSCLPCLPGRQESLPHMMPHNVRP